MPSFVSLGLVATAALLLFLLIKIFSTPLRWAAKLFMNAIVGFVALGILNYLGSYINIELGVNWINAIIVGILGMPGVILLLLLKYVF